MITLENEILNMENALSVVRKINMLNDPALESDVVLTALNIDDIADSMELYQLIQTLAEKELELNTNTDGLNDDEIDELWDLNSETISNEFYNCGYQINRIDRNSDLLTALVKWYGGINNVVDHVRSAVLHEGNLYFVTGIGYDWFSSDVLNLSDNENARQLFNKVIMDKPLTDNELNTLEHVKKAI